MNGAFGSPRTLDFEWFSSMITNTWLSAGMLPPSAPDFADDAAGPIATPTAAATAASAVAATTLIRRGVRRRVPPSLIDPLLVESWTVGDPNGTRPPRPKQSARADEAPSRATCARARARIRGERMRYVCGVQLPVQLLILADEGRVAAADVEREERRVTQELRVQPVGERVHARLLVRLRRAEVEHLRPRRVGRLEVAAPRLDDGEATRLPEADARRAVAPGRDADDRAAAAVRDRAVVRVDVRGQLDAECSRPVVAGPPVVVLGIAVLAPRSLRDDEEGGPARVVEGVLDPGHRAVGRRAGRQAVQEVDDGIPPVAARVAVGEPDQEVQRAVERAGVKGDVLGRGSARVPPEREQRRRRGHGGPDEHRGEHDCQPDAHRYRIPDPVPSARAILLQAGLE